MNQHFYIRHRIIFVAFALLVLHFVSLSTTHAAANPCFSFIQVSDVHTPMAQSKEVISLIDSIGEVEMTAYGVTAPKPSFVIVTGDLTEFGAGSGAWEEYISYWKNCPLPVYHVLGNHDNTWHACVQPLRKMGQRQCYFFDRDGCRFIGLTTATVQDPRPSIGEEQINWLKENLLTVNANTPIFVFFHHPLGITEFASRYDYDRLLDVLQDYNAVLLMAGHSHGYVYRPFESWDQITGGSTFGPNAGLMFVSVCDGVLRAAYRKSTEPTASIKIFEKTIPNEPTYPKIEILSPQRNAKITNKLTISARVSRITNVTKAVFTVDDKVNGDLVLSGSAPVWNAEGSADVNSLLPGAHYLRVDFQDGDKHYTRSTQFFLEPTTNPTAWRVYLGASSKVTPTVVDGVLYVGANDGKLRAFDAKDGRELWSVDTGAEILAQPLVVSGRVYSANGLGVVAAYSAASGEPLWTFSADEAVYSSPIEVDGKIVFGCNSGKLYAIDAATGKLVWVNEDAGYSIESKPFVSGDRIYYGAWDTYIRCVDARTGQLIWKELGEGSRIKKAKKYYSPADCGPVVVDGNLMVADRDYMLTILNAQTGERIKAMKEVAAVGLSEDGRHAYLRKTNGELVKIDRTGRVIWSTVVEMDVIPAAPIEKNGMVYAISKRGLLSAVSAESGKVLWQYQASPQLFVMSSPATDGTKVYVTAFDGHLTAINSDLRAHVENPSQ
jgi:outer membrane protein assembly factor BamB/Icc-related predicted phosphoesterase